jgi:Ni/Fe-hydrogenase b-type cytochrome subunit
MDDTVIAQSSRLVKRHGLSTRLWHWVNAVTLLILLMSGLMIFNAHPRLYWGHYGANSDKAWLELPRFPGWATLPSGYSLADARLWHLAFAWVLSLALLFFIIRSLWNGHIRRDLHITQPEWSIRHIWQDVKNHARLRFPAGEDVLKYNILQKLSYIGVIFIAIPLMIFTGLTMSPGMNAAWPWLADIFGGRQSARSVHFIVTFALVAFFAVHMAMVLLAGPINELRSIITGYYKVAGNHAALPDVPHDQ